MNFINILEVACDGDIATVVSAIKTVFTLIQWAIPLVLIVMGTIDMFKAMASGDEKATKAAKDKFIKRLIYAVVAFLIPFIISLTFTFVGRLITQDNDAEATYDDFWSCWTSVSSKSGNGGEKTGKCLYPAGNYNEGVSKDSCNCDGCQFIPN